MTHNHASAKLAANMAFRVASAEAQDDKPKAEHRALVLTETMQFMRREDIAAAYRLLCRAALVLQVAAMVELSFDPAVEDEG